MDERGALGLPSQQRGWDAWEQCPDIPSFAARPAAQPEEWALAMDSLRQRGAGPWAPSEHPGIGQASEESSEPLLVIVGTLCLTLFCRWDPAQDHLPAVKGWSGVPCL